jgi:hypothetical protein
MVAYCRGTKAKSKSTVPERSATLGKKWLSHPGLSLRVIGQHRYHIDSPVYNAQGLEANTGYYSDLGS